MSYPTAAVMVRGKQAVVRVGFGCEAKKEVLQVGRNLEKLEISYDSDGSVLEITVIAQDDFITIADAHVIKDKKHMNLVESTPQLGE